MTPYLIYNITTKITVKIHNQWLQWLKEKYIPSMIQTGCFYSALVCKVREKAEDITYAVQYYAEKDSDFELFKKDHQRRFQLMTTAQWGENSIDFSTVLEVVN